MAQNSLLSLLGNLRFLSIGEKPRNLFTLVGKRVYKTERRDYLNDWAKSGDHGTVVGADGEKVLILAWDNPTQLAMEYNNRVKYDLEHFSEAIGFVEEPHAWEGLLELA